MTTLKNPMYPENLSLDDELRWARKRVEVLSEKLTGEEPLEDFDELSRAVNAATRLEKERRKLRKLQRFHGGK